MLILLGFIATCCGECYFGCLQFVCFPRGIYVSVCIVCVMFDCVGELFVVE